MEWVFSYYYKQIFLKVQKEILVIKHMNYDWHTELMSIVRARILRSYHK